VRIVRLGGHRSQFEVPGGSVAVLVVDDRLL